MNWRGGLWSLTLVLLIAGTVPAAKEERLKGDSVPLSVGIFHELTLNPNQIVPLVYSDRISSSTSSTLDGFYLIQAHTVHANVTISYTPKVIVGQSATGSDVGLVINGSVVVGKEGGKVLLAYLISDADLLVPIRVLLLLQHYNANAPIPGGCNMEHPIKTTPYLPTSFTSNVVTVEYPLGSYPSNVRPATCDRAPLQYDLFIHYLPEKDLSSHAAFNALRMMTNVTWVEKYGTKVSFNGIPPNKVKLANYAGTGRIVVVILRTLTDSAVYVPSLSYGCMQNNDSSSNEYGLSCDAPELGSVGSKLFSSCAIFAGLFLATLGHRYYKCQLFLFGSLLTGLAFYVGLTLSLATFTTTTAVMTAGAIATVGTVVGAMGGSLLVIVWAKCGTPIGPVFLASFILGTLVAATLSFTPLVDVAVMKDNLTFWLAFFCIIFTVSLLIVSLDKLANISASCLLGSFLFIAPIDGYVGSNLRYLFLNVMRRATDPQFANAIVRPPYQALDIIMTFTWISLAAAGFCFQLWRERDRAPFPPSPYNWNSSTTPNGEGVGGRPYQRLMSEGHNSVGEEDGDGDSNESSQVLGRVPHYPVVIHIPTETTPLLHS